MANGLATESSGSIRTICLPIGEEEYQRMIDDAPQFRGLLDCCYDQMPELFPKNFSQGYELKDCRVSAKTQVKIRRIELRDGTSYSVRPSFLLPYMTGMTDEVERPLFLRKFGVPHWALAYVFGGNAMYWYRLEISLGRNSIVGTTVRNTELPVHLLADEHHQPRDGEKNYIATTVGGGCCLGAAVAETAGTEELKDAYAVFCEEARDVAPDYAPKTVNTDGWKGTQAAWKALYPAIIVVQCFLHAWLKIRDRAKHLGESFAEISRRVWDTYHAAHRRSFSQRIAALRAWAEKCLSGVVLENIVDLCEKRDRWANAYGHPGCQRTSNMLDRIMRSMNRYFDNGQHLHGSLAPSQLHCRSWALLYNFAPWSPATTRDNNGWRSPAERLNKHRYHDNWLHNLLVSASLGGYRNCSPQNP
ncbi:MAG: hypothetical protein WBE98_05630 [Gammaproteobacteria bacterium]